MHWEPCEVCGGVVIIFDLTKTPTGYRCMEDCGAIPFADPPRETEEEEDERDPLQKEFGFDKPEDGSERRFVFSAVKNGQAMPWQDQKVTVPWVKFRFWWLVHNAVAHPLIALAPRRRFFEFHDYTSRKMHGK